MGTTFEQEAEGSVGSRRSKKQQQQDEEARSDDGFRNPLSASAAADPTVAVPPDLPRTLREVHVGANHESTWFSADGRWFAVAGQNKCVAFWDTVTGQTARACERPANIFTTSISPDGSHFCVGGADRRLVMHGFTPGDPANAPMRWDRDLGEQVCAATFSPDGQLLAVVDDADRLHILRASTGDDVVQLAGKGGDFDFQAGSRWGAHGLHFVAGQLACSGNGKDFKRVRLWSVDGWQVKATMKFGKNKHCCRLSPDGKQLACGGAGALLHLCDVHSLGDEPVRIFLHDSNSSIRTIRYSPDGATLACGRWDGGMFYVINVRTQQLVQRFAHPESCGLALCFAPQGDVLACGGALFQRCVFHQMRPSVPVRRYLLDTDVPAGWPVGKLSGSRGWVVQSDRYLVACDGNTVGNTNHGNSRSSAAGDTVVDAVKGSVIQIFERASMRAGFVGAARGDVGPVHRFDAGQMVSVASLFANALAIRSDSTQLCAVLSYTTPTVFALPSGRKLFSVEGCGRILGARWSTDDSHLIVNGDNGCKVCDGSSGQPILTVEDNIAVAFAVGLFTPVSKILITAGSFRAVIVRDVTSSLGRTGGAQAKPKLIQRWEESSLTQGIYFDEKKERVVYSTQREVVVRHWPSGGQIARFANASVNSTFCPTDDALLALGTGMGRDSKYFGRKLRMVSLVTGADTSWGPLVHSLFDQRLIPGYSVGWTVDADGLTLVRAAEEVGVVEYAARDLQLTVEDGQFHQSQLVNLYERYPARVGALAETHQFCVNVADQGSGDTVLHHLARKRDSVGLDAWLGGDTECVYTPIANHDGQTALHEAISNFNVPGVVTLLGALSNNLNSASSPLLTDALIQIAERMPRLILPGFEAMEPAVVQTYNSFRCVLSEVQVRGQDSLFNDATCEDALNPKVEDDSGQSLWQDLESMPETAEAVIVDCSVVAMQNFLGDCHTSPLHAIVINCDATVFSNQLIRLAVMYKWRTSVYSLVQRHMAFHLCCLLISSATMIFTTQQHLETHGEDDAEAMIAHVLQGLTIVAAILALGMQVMRMLRQGTNLYLDSLWNIFDVTASLSLLIAASGHFMDVHTEVIQSLGAIGVSLKWFGFLDYLRAFRSTGPLVRMITVVTYDIGPFVSILLLVVVGSTFFFSINLPGEAAWSANNVLGPFWPALTMVQFVLGNFDIERDFPKTTSVVFIVLVAFFVVILMLNLLIAIMQDSYDKVKEREEIEGLREKGKTVVAMEQMWPGQHTHPRYMHIAVPRTNVSDLEEAKRQRDKGMGGRIADRVSADFTQRMGALERKMDARSQDLEAKVDAVAGEMTEIKALLEKLASQPPTR